MINPMFIPPIANDNPSVMERSYSYDTYLSDLQGKLEIAKINFVSTVYNNLAELSFKLLQSKDYQIVL
jgi:hypothetical protein